VPSWDLDYEVGRQGELFVVRIADAVRDGRHEVKTDERAIETQRVYLECQCLYRGEWKPSGIATTEADVWWHVIGECVIAAPTYRVREIARRYWRTHRKDMNRGSHPTRGVVLPIALFIRELTQGLSETQQEEVRLP
jgi:hypothetical protein